MLPYTDDANIWLHIALLLAGHPTSLINLACTSAAAARLCRDERLWCAMYARRFPSLFRSLGWNYHDLPDRRWQDRMRIDVSCRQRWRRINAKMNMTMEETANATNAEAEYVFHLSKSLPGCHRFIFGTTIEVARASDNAESDNWVGTIGIWDEQEMSVGFLVLSLPSFRIKFRRFWRPKAYLDLPVALCHMERVAYGAQLAISEDLVGPDDEPAWVGIVYATYDQTPPVVLDMKPVWLATAIARPEKDQVWVYGVDEATQLCIRKVPLRPATVLVAEESLTELSVNSVIFPLDLDPAATVDALNVHTSNPAVVFVGYSTGIIRIWDADREIPIAVLSVASAPFSYSIRLVDICWESFTMDLSKRTMNEAKSAMFVAAVSENTVYTWSLTQISDTGLTREGFWDPVPFDHSIEIPSSDLHVLSLNCGLLLCADDLGKTVVLDLWGSKGDDRVLASLDMKLRWEACTGWNNFVYVTDRKRIKAVRMI